jgi:uncharacterized membrane protein
MHEYKDLRTLTNVAAGALLIYMVARLLLLGATLWAYQSAGGSGDMSSALGLIAIVSVVFLVALLACFVLVGRWIYRASANAHALSDEMTISPGWAVGWYFIPFANLVKPYQAMLEIWMASHFRGNWHGEPSPSLVTGWWGLWIVVNILDNISVRLGSLDENGGILGMTLTFDVAAGLLNAALCLILITLMRRVARAQSTAPYEETFA